jgi:hypothetical protein
MAGEKNKMQTLQIFFYQSEGQVYIDRGICAGQADKRKIDSYSKYCTSWTLS